MLFTSGAGTTADSFMDSYITTSAFSGALMFNASAAPSDFGAGSSYLNAQIMADHTNALFGVGFSANGVNVWQYDGTWDRVQYACATSSWHAFMFYYDGTNLNARLDNGGWSSVARSAGFGGFGLSSQNWAISGGPYSSASFSGSVMEAGLSKVDFSHTDFDNYYSYLKTTYPSAGLP